MMRICRVTTTLPTAAGPGGGLGQYRLTQYIPEPCLLLTPATAAYPPLPAHVTLVPLPLGGTRGPLPHELRARVFAADEDVMSRTRVQARLVARVLRQHARGMGVALAAMRQFRPDLVVCHSLHRLAYGLAARRLQPCKLLLYLHNVSEVDALAQMPLLRLLLRIPERVVGVSPEIARRLAAWLPEQRIGVTSTGVDTDVFQDRQVPRRRQLVTVAHLKWTKGYGDLVDAAARIFARCPDYRWLIVGEGQERPAVVDAVRRHGLDDRIVFTGPLARDGVAATLNESRLFVLASIREGLPKALLEALACGTPAVVTEACNAEGIIDTTGIRVPPRDPGALAEAIVTLLTDEARWRRCSDRGPEVAARYDWKSVAARDHALYRAVLAP